MEISSVTAFKKLGIESFTINRDCTRVAVSSHNGEVKIWKLGETSKSQFLNYLSTADIWQSGIKENLWVIHVGDMDPWALAYVNDDKELVVFGLEMGKMWVIFK